MKKLVILLFAVFINFCVKAETSPPTGTMPATTVEELKVFRELKINK